MWSEIFLFATVNGIKILPRCEHASSMIERGLTFFFATVSGFKILPRKTFASQGTRVNGEGMSPEVFFFFGGEGS